MARRVSKPGVITGLAHEYFPSFLRSRANAWALDAWVSGKQYDISENLDPDSPFYGRPYSPRDTTDEYDDLASRAPSAYAGLIVATLAQTAYLDGVRMPGKLDNMNVWKTWQANRMDSRQTAINRAAIGTGTAYGVVLPGQDPLTGAARAKMVGKSAKKMSAFYEDDEDEWSRFAIEAEPTYEVVPGADWQAQRVKKGWQVKVYDESAIHNLVCEGDGTSIDDWTYVSFEEHPLGVPPVARLCNRLDLDGQATGEIEPVLPLLRRIDQDTFDRLIVQRYGAWKIRYIAGMAKPDSATMANLQALKLKVEDLLISDNPATKFGTLDASDVKQFIDAHDADLRVLSAISQMPPHHLLGVSSNLQAEALAAAESGLQRKSHDFKMNAGEFYEQMFRMCAMVTGDIQEATAVDMQVRWRDTESRSLTQAADALGKLAVQLKVPVEMLWEKIPGWTDSDTERAKELVQDGTFEQLLAELGLGNQGTGGQNPPTQDPTQQGGTGGNSGQ